MASDTTHHTAPAATSTRFDTEVRAIMRPGVVVVPDGASLLEAQRAMLSHGVHAVLVLDRDGGGIAGWVTSRGLLGWCDRDLALMPVRNAVSEPPVTVHPSAPARKALALLERHQVHHLLVTRSHDEIPEGVVGDVDLLKLVS